LTMFGSSETPTAARLIHKKGDYMACVQGT
jgi:hypothetical protein